jgi:hypothetical protein
MESKKKEKKMQKGKERGIKEKDLARERFTKSKRKLCNTFFSCLRGLTEDWKRQAELLLEGSQLAQHWTGIRASLFYHVHGLAALSNKWSWGGF